ncbi:MAG: DUF4058 family protein [Planctomycetia bacterium]|nr:DUF4058 family protein [Planctomycetia bacterium]
MPIHDWTRVDAGLFHAFHQSWTINISNALNGGVLPEDYFALPEQRISGPIPDVLTLHRSEGNGVPANGYSATGVAVATAPPRLQKRHQRKDSGYAAKANRIAIRNHRHGKVVAVLEIVSPGNKASSHEFRAFVEKARYLMDEGIHLAVIDLFPPTPRDPDGIHFAIWNDVGVDEEDDLERPVDKPLTVVSYDAGEDSTAYLEYLAVGDALPEAPIFLSPGHYVNLPLEPTYETTWQLFPNVLKPLLSQPS